MILHRAPWLLPICAPPVREGGVLVDERGRVTAVGEARALEERSSEVHAHDGVLMPGLVNAHAHVELSYLGAVPGGDGLVAWVRRLLAERARRQDPLDEARAAEAQAAELTQRGTVALADTSNGGRVAHVLRGAGLELLDLDERIAPRGVPTQPARDRAVATPHATYSCGAPAIRALAQASGGQVRSIHVEEDADEVVYQLHGTGRLRLFLDERETHPEGTPAHARPLFWLDSLSVIGPRTLLVHLTVADDDTLALVAARSAVAVLCPRSNLHITGQLPPWQRMHALGLRIALGSDSLCSSPSLDVLGDVQVLARAGADCAWLLRAVTDGGAQALELEHLGALAVGRCPGLITVGEDARGLADPVAWVAHEGADAPVRRVA